MYERRNVKNRNGIGKNINIGEFKFGIVKELKYLETTIII